MDLSKEAIEKIEELSDLSKRVVKIDDKTYAPFQLHPIFHDPRPAVMKLCTLSGMVDYVKNNKDGLACRVLTVHVKSYNYVSLIGIIEGPTKARTVYIESTLAEGLSTFRFGQWMDKEQFIINLMSQFVPNNNLNELLELAGKMKAEKVSQIDDDGVTQTVKARKGIALSEDKKISNPWNLIPYRTFREIEQPASNFIFRVKENQKEDSMPMCALFEADGSEWQLTAISRIKEYIRTELPEIAVIA